MTQSAEPAPDSQPPVPPMLVLGIGILAVSASAVLIRFAQAEAASLAIAAWRTGLATLALLPFALVRRREELASMGRSSWGLACVSGVFLGIHFASWISSLEYTSVLSSTVLVTTNPIWVALASPFLLNERLSRALRVGIGLAIVGSLIITLGDGLVVEEGRVVGFAFGGGGERPLLGNLLALIGAVSAAAYIIIGRRLRPRLSLLSYTTVVYGCAALLLLLTTLLAGESLFGFSPTTYLLLVLMAIFPQLIGHTSFNWALKYLPAAYVSVTVLGEPIGASILAFFILRDLPNAPLVALLGSGLIFAGIVIASRRQGSVNK